MVFVWGNGELLIKFCGFVCDLLINHASIQHRNIHLFSLDGWTKWCVEFSLLVLGNFSVRSRIAVVGQQAEIEWHSGNLYLINPLKMCQFFFLGRRVRTWEFEEKWSSFVDLFACSILRVLPGRRKKKKETTWRIFSLKELQSATNNFNYDNKLGEGGFGSVYWGQLWDGSQVRCSSFNLEKEKKNRKKSENHAVHTAQTLVCCLFFFLID